MIICSRLGRVGMIAIGLYLNISIGSMGAGLFEQMLECLTKRWRFGTDDVDCDFLI